VKLYFEELSNSRLTENSIVELIPLFWWNLIFNTFFMKLIKYLLVFTYVGIIIGFIVAIPEHIIDHSWSVHAKNHVLQTLFWIVGYAIINIVIVLIPFSQKQQWSWWLLLFSGVVFYAGYFLSIFYTNGGAPGLKDDIFFGVLGGIYLICMIISKKYFKA